MIGSVLLVFTASSDASARPASAVHALLINGGDKPSTNYLSHLEHLQEMVAALGERGVPADRIHIFSADGDEPADDLSSLAVAPANFWLIADTALGNRLKPRIALTNTNWPGATLRPARLAALEEWFESSLKRMTPGDRLLVFVTDHGTNRGSGTDNASISLWGEKLTLRDFKGLISRVPQGVQTVLVMSQCYSGAFADAMYDGAAGDPTGRVCGFFSTTAQRRAYGCYAEGRGRERIGHAFDFIDGLRRRTTAADAHLEVLVADDSPDVPLRTSDMYLDGIVSEEAKARGVPIDTLMDSLLAEAWKAPAPWRAEIALLDRIATSFGTAAPRMMEDVSAQDREIETLREQIDGHARRWKSALTAVKETLVQAFLAARPEWRQRIQGDALNAADAVARAELLRDVLAHIEPFARVDPQLWPKLERFHEHASRGSEAVWRLQVRRAAIARMKTVLVRIAGRVLIESSERRKESSSPEARSSARADTLNRLERCEAFSLGKTPARSVSSTTDTRAPYPPLSVDVALLNTITPSWLGVRFRAAPEAMRTRHNLSAGAMVVDTVIPQSPASDAGLIVGDIITGTPEGPFVWPHQLREWTMTAPANTPLTLVTLRGSEGGEYRTADTQVVLRPYPLVRRDGRPQG